MQLVACVECRRHIDASEPRCPFCSARPRTTVASFRSVIGRASRAAVFASAAACASSTPHTTPPPPPPPPDPVVIQKFATAPAPAEGKASVRGFLLREGRPVPNATVYARDDKGVGSTATTGPHGEFEFVDLAPGAWHLTVDSYTYDPYAGSRAPQEGGMAMQPDTVVQLEAGNNKRQDVALPALQPPAPRGPCCKPYGAPPARRRIV